MSESLRAAPVTNPKIKKNQVACFSCNGITFSRGRIPESSYFAGSRLDKPLNEGELLACPNCHLNFRWPRPSKDILDSLYKHGRDTNWQYLPSEREDWGITKRQLERIGVGKTVLDVGCFDGGFLRYLGDDWKRYGVEIHPAAARCAQGHGIEILQDDLARLEGIDREFDCVVAFDVIEHVEDPAQFLRSLSGLTKKGGIIIVSTGNTAAWSWKLMGSRYWYCAIPEHVSFIDRTWCEKAAQSIGLGIRNVTYFSHSNKAKRATRMKELFVNLAYTYFPRSFALARSMGLGGIDIRENSSLRNHPPGWRSAKDHLLVCFETR